MRKFFYLITILLILGDIFLFTVSSDFRILGILFVYIFFVKALKLKSNVAFILSLFFLLLAYVQFIFSNQIIYINGSIAPDAEKTAVWVFLLMVVGIIQKWRE